MENDNVQANVSAGTNAQPQQPATPASKPAAQPAAAPQATPQLQVAQPQVASTPTQPFGQPVPQQQPQPQGQPVAPYGQYAPFVQAPETKLSGGAKFGWLLIGLFLGIPGMLLAWLTNIGKPAPIKDKAILFAVFGFVIAFVVAVICVLVFGFSYSSRWRYSYY